MANSQESKAGYRVCCMQQSTKLQTLKGLVAGQTKVTGFRLKIRNILLFRRKRF
jgi:hypothetical protein